MKKTILAYALALLAALSCSTTSRLQTQAFDDGIYTTPSVKPAQAPAPTSEELDNLLADSKSSDAYILSAGDTLVVPAGKKLKFSNSDTIITVWDTPSWAWDYSWAYRPWYMAPWDPFDPWYYDRWYFRPWTYGPWHYDPWFWPPFNYSYYGYYSPWYRYHYYDGWYWGRPWYHGHFVYWGGGPVVHRSHAARLGHREGNFSARGAASRSTMSRTRGGSASRAASSRA